MDVIFMAYANSDQQPLKLIRKEYEDVYGVLTDNYVQDSYCIHRDNFTSISSMNEYLGKFSCEIAVFSYSGHAGDKHVLLDDKLSNAEGLVEQLGGSVNSGALKLVLLNGCSTAGQVKRLLEIGVPVVVATNAPVDDQSATEFAIRFFSNLFEKELSFKLAFEDAMGPAKSGTAANLNGMRHIAIDQLGVNEPLWGIYGKPHDLDTNPFTNKSQPQAPFIPNARLFNFLFDVFNKAGNPETLALKKREDENEIVEDFVKRDALLYSIPFPIAANLQNLVNIQASQNDYKNEDEYRMKWLAQAGQLYHVTSEFMGLIIIAQLWETKLRFSDIEIPDELQKALKEFFYLKSEDRAVYDYIPLTRMIREFLDSLSHTKEIRFFVEEQLILKDIVLPGFSFAEACGFLLRLHRDSLAKKKRKNLQKDCERAEDHLCNFFNEMGFLYRYHLTSITQIDILKYRHLPTAMAQYKHQIIKLMRPLKSAEEQTFFQYFMPTFLDNWTVVLIKNKKEKIRNASAKEIDIETLDFLNLSPFVIDRLVFEEKRDKSSLMFFNRYWDNDDIYEFNDASCPMKSNDHFRVMKMNLTNKKKYELESIRVQFKAFREEVLGETLS